MRECFCGNFYGSYFSPISYDHIYQDPNARRVLISSNDFFYLSFSLVDTIAQLFFREVYRFRPLIVSGDFDLPSSNP